MRARVKKWGNSLAVRIPKSVAVETGLGENAAVEMSVEEDRIVVRPSEKPLLRLEDLLKDVTPEGIHREIDWGPPTGKELW